MACAMRSSSSMTPEPQNWTATRQSALMSVVADMNDSAIEHMTIGAYAKANAILVEAIQIMEFSGGTPNRLVDPLTYPLQFPVTSQHPKASLLETNTVGSYAVPCRHTPATAVSFALTSTGTGSSRPLDGSTGSPPALRSFGPSRPVPTSSRSDGGGNNNSNNAPGSSFPAAAGRASSRQRLTVRLPVADETVITSQQTAVYHRAFLLYRNTCTPRIASAILKYNAALCAHLHSVVTGNACVAPHRALCLYSAAYSDVLAEQQQRTLDWLFLQHQPQQQQQQQQQSQMQGSDTASSRPNNAFSLSSEADWLWNENSRTAVLLQAALCHNMAAIHGDCFWNFAHARLLRCQLAAVIHWTAFSQMDTDDFVFFHLGIFFALIDDYRLAPAA